MPPSELLVKGVFLGLVLHAARLLGLADHACWRELGLLMACAAGGWVLGTLATLGRPRSGSIGSRLMLGLLEDGWLAQAGLVVGLGAGIVAFLHPIGGEDAAGWLLGLSLAGAMLGFVFAILQQIPSRAARLGIGAALGLIMVGTMGLALGLWGTEGLARVRPPGCVVAGLWLLAALVLHIGLVLTSLEPESEAELGCVTTALPGLGVYLASGATGWGLGLGLLIPSLAYLLLGEGIAGRIRLGKLLTRARLNMSIGNWRKALGCSSRALGIDPGNPRALADFWRLTSKLDTEELLADTNARSLVRAERCLDWVGRRLGSNPGPVGLEECDRMLALVEKLDPPLIPQAEYWRVVADLHAGQTEVASRRARALLEAPADSSDAAGPARQARRQLWLLAMAWHDRLRGEVAEPLLKARPEAVLEAWEAVEQALEADTENPRLRAAWRSLVERLDESRHGPLVDKGGPAVDWRRVEGLAVGMLEDPNRRARGCELVRLAARANPSTSPASLVAVARALQAAGEEQPGIDHFRMAVSLAQKQGIANLSAEDRELYFRAVKYLAEVAEHQENWAEAARLWTLYTENDRSGLETLRKLAELHEKLGDPAHALRAVEKGLLYAGKDTDLLERRERYLWSITPEQVQASPDTFKGIIDPAFCAERARKALDSNQADPEWLRFAEHLLRLALLVRPDHLPSRQMLGRALARLGDRDGAVAEWEKVRTNKPSNWVEGESDEAWQRANQALGDAYLEMGRYQDAIDCLEDFRKSSRSGANTLFKLGQAHEGLGQFRQARKHYREVEGFEGNPLVWQAREALDRIRQAEAGPPG
jgi:tetratricopeptide (TPR) repeat protein